MKISYTRAADRDLNEAYDYIAKDNPDAARRELERILHTSQRLASQELKGPTVRLLSGRTANRWSVPPYRIYYRQRADQISILRVYHQARRPIEQ